MERTGSFGPGRTRRALGDCRDVGRGGRSGAGAAATPSWPASPARSKAWRPARCRLPSSCATAPPRWRSGDPSPMYPFSAIAAAPRGCWSGSAGQGGVHCGGDRQRPCQWRTRRGRAERRGQGGGSRSPRERIGAGAEERRPAPCRGEEQPQPDGDQPAPDPGAPGAASGNARTLPRRRRPPASTSPSAAPAR